MTAESCDLKRCARHSAASTLYNVGFALRRGEIWIVGPNGSGETTALNLISGALRPDAGEIALAGC